MKKKKQGFSSVSWVVLVIIGGFGLMLFTSLVAYKVESKYLKAYQHYTLSQQGRIDQLERLLKEKEEEIRTLKQENL